MSARGDDSERTPAAYIGSAIAVIILIWVFNALPGWELAFITSEVTAVLWAINLSLGVQLAGNLLLLFFHPRFLHHLVQVLFAALSLLALVIILTVYPFRFDGTLEQVVPIVLYVAIGGAVISGVVHAIKAIGSFFGSTAD